MGLGTMRSFLGGVRRSAASNQMADTGIIMSKSHVGHMRVRWVRTTEMELLWVKLTVEPLRIQRVIARDLGYESNGWVKIVVVLTAKG